MSTGLSNPNKLINEKSPYLLQHATNPVDWYPWGNDAFEKARLENKPIFLSIGYLKFTKGGIFLSSWYIK